MAKDLFHDVVKEALIAEGWQITHNHQQASIGPLLGKDALQVSKFHQIGAHPESTR